MPYSDLALTYDECRARFRRAALLAGGALIERPIQAPGPFGQQLSIDATSIGAPDAERCVLLMSGVHGVEGFIGSAVQIALLERIANDGDTAVPSDTKVVFIHAVNPYGMAWWRRTNESNVDLNRNWMRDSMVVQHNEAYDEIHHILSPNSETVPTDESFIEQMTPVLETRGLDWIRSAVSDGQYRHQDGMLFGGDRTEESNRILEGLVPELLASASAVVGIDVHTGYGECGSYTLLSEAVLDQRRQTIVEQHFDASRVELLETASNPTISKKPGQIINGLGEQSEASFLPLTLEFGTVDEIALVMAGRRELWVHEHGSPLGEHQVDTWDFRSCYTVDAPTWAASCHYHGERVIAQALSAVADL